MQRFRGPLANVCGPPPYTSEALSKRLLRLKGPFRSTNHSYCSASHRSSTPVALLLVDILLGPTVMFLMAARKTTPNPLRAKSYASLPNSAIAFSPFRLYTQRSGELESQSSRRRYPGGSNECPPATVSSYTVVVSHLAFGTLSLRSINAPRGRRPRNVWISRSQDGPQGSQHLIRFSVGHFALAQGNPRGISYETLAPKNIVTRGVRPESPSCSRAALDR